MPRSLLVFACLLVAPGIPLAAPSPLPATPQSLASQPSVATTKGQAQRSASDAADKLLLEDPPQPLTEKVARNEAEEDRLQALALFATARALERQEEYAAALEHYQRAFRYDPKSGEILSCIVHLGARLNRAAEVARYARKSADLDDGDPGLLARLGLLLAKQGDWEAAATVYGKVLKAQRGEKFAAADVVLHLELGKLYHLLEKYDLAADSFSRVLYAVEHPEESGLNDKLKAELISEPGPMYNLFGEAFLHAGRHDAARNAFEKSYKATRDRGLRGFHLAQVDAQAGLPEKALANLQLYFDQALSSEGTAPYRLLADVLQALGKADELIPRLEKLHAEDSANIPLGYALAGYYREKEQFDKAEKLYQAVLKKSPNMVGHRGLVEIYRKTRRAEPLLLVLGQAVAKTSALEPLGPEVRAVCEDRALVEALLAAARKLHKSNSKKLDYNTRVAMALLSLQQKDFDAAREFFDLAIAAQPKKAPELLLEWGLALMLQEKAALAIEVLQRGTELKATPESRSAFYYYLAGALASEKRYDEALAAARKAAEGRKENARLNGRAAWVLYVAKRHDEAFKAYTALIDRFGSEYDSPDTRQALREAKLMLSNLCVLTHRPAQAEQWLEQVLDEFPDDVSALNDLGYLWAERGVHRQRALRMTQAAVDEDPDNLAYRDSLGWALYQLGRYEQAAVELEKAAAGDRPDAVILEHLGDTYHKLGLHDKARQAWKRAVAAFREEKEEDKALRVESKIKGK